MTRAPGSRPPKSAPDLTGLRGSYRYRYPRALVISQLVLACFFAVHAGQFFWGGVDRFEFIASLTALGGYALSLSAVFFPPLVKLDETGIHVRPTFRWQTLAWEDVVEVREDPFGRHPRAWLVSRRSVPLRGLPIETGVRLQAALAERALP